MDMTDWPAMEATTASCQCGAIRMNITAGPHRTGLCHCRMCQRATGGPFFAFINVPSARITTTGTPAIFHSSEGAERGFCGACGSPLFFRPQTGDTIAIAFGTLHKDFPFAPIRAIGGESRCAWLDAALDIDAGPTTKADVKSLQASE